MDDVCCLDMVELARRIANRELSSTELTRAYLERIERFDPLLRAFITVDAERAVARAKAADTTLPSGALHGVPIAVKDNIATRGLRTTAGSRVLSSWVPDADAPVVRSLADAGAVLIGKTNLHEFAYGGTCTNVEFGAVRNPWNPAHVPGGSSGGSGVAVAAGLCAAALGTDTAGSVRLPAAQCGVVGLKPTYGRTSIQGVIPLAWSLDHAGPMCRSARDAALMLEALTGKAVRDRAVNVKTLRLGVPRALFYEDLDPEVRKAVVKATDTLSRITSGARDVVLPMPAQSRDLPVLPETYVRILGAEAHAFHLEMLHAHPDRYNAGTRKSIESGAAVTAADYIRARQDMQRLRAESGRLFADADLLITPTAPAAAFEFGVRRVAFLRNTAPWNLLGLPSVSVPCGFTTEGLPIGLQITGAAGRDNAVLALAALYQKATDWHTRHPPIG